MTRRVRTAADRKLHAAKVARDRELRVMYEMCRQCDQTPEIKESTGVRYVMCREHRKVDAKRKRKGS